MQARYAASVIASAFPIPVTPEVSGNGNGNSSRPSRDDPPRGARGGTPVSRVALRRQLGVKNLHLGHVLTSLESEHVICRTTAGWSISKTSPTQLHLAT